MLYTNTNICGVTRRLSEDNVRYGYPVGCRGKDEYEVFILATRELLDSMPTIKAHQEYPNLNVVKTPNGNLKITDQGDVGEIFLVISSQYLNPADGTGKVTIISMNGTPTAEFLGKGVTAVRDSSGAIKGLTDTLIIKAKPGSLVKVRWAGFEKNKLNDTFYYVSPMGRVNEFSALEMEKSFKEKGFVPNWITNGIRSR